MRYQHSSASPRFTESGAFSYPSGDPRNTMRAMSTWADLRSGAPSLAETGMRLIRARGDGEALLATVRGDGSPRLHPVNVDVVDGRLYVFVGRSPKRTDLETDGRYALHTHVDPEAPDE